MGMLHLSKRASSCWSMVPLPSWSYLWKNDCRNSRKREGLRSISAVSSCALDCRRLEVSWLVVWVVKAGGGGRWEGGVMKGRCGGAIVWTRLKMQLKSAHRHTP